MRRLAAVGFALLSFVFACTQAGVLPPPRAPSTSVNLPEVKTGPTSAMQAMRRLCVQPKIVAPPVARRPTPPSIAKIESEVEAVRGLRYLRPVNVEPVSPAEIDRRLRDYFTAAYPKRFYARRTDAWATIGAIPGGVGILEALNRYQQGQVLGFYNSQNGELVYTGDEHLSRIEQFILAHELTHAIDDQHFDLDRLDEIAMTCQDERFLAALGTVEGSANYFATQVIFRFPVAEIGDVPGGGTQGVPPLIVELQAYPYTLGQAFVDSLADDGGPAAVDRALRRFPATTEQVIHPAKFPGDTPQRVDIPDFAPTFGPGWHDHDLMVVGEVWLRALLHTRLDQAEAERAAAGWDGGMYRAWTDGHDVAVVMSTVWDSPEDAKEFGESLSRWAEHGEGLLPLIVVADERVQVAFASNEELLPVVSSTLGSI